MESQPTELLLQQILLLDYRDILNLCSVNERLRTLCKDNKEYIYKKLLQRDFGFYNRENSSKVIYSLLTDIYNSDRNFTVFSIYEAIKSHNYKRVSYLVNLGFKGRFKNVNITPLEYVLVQYIPNDPEVQRIVDLLVNTTIESGDVDTISLRSYTLSKKLSDEQKRRLLNRFANVINTPEFLSSIKDEYFRDDLAEVISYIKTLVKTDNVQFLIPQPIDIVEAIKINDINTLNTMLLDKKYTQTNLDNALSLAVFMNRIDLIDILLTNGANVNNDNGKPLQEAINSSSVETVDYLLKKGADINPVINNVVKSIVKRSRYDIAELILGSNISLANVKPRYIQELFKMFRRKVREDLIQILESNNCVGIKK